MLRKCLQLLASTPLPPPYALHFYCSFNLLKTLNTWRDKFCVYSPIKEVIFFLFALQPNKLFLFYLLPSSESIYFAFTLQRNFFKCQVRTFFPSTSSMIPSEKKPHVSPGRFILFVNLIVYSLVEWTAIISSFIVMRVLKRNYRWKQNVSPHSDNFFNSFSHLWWWCTKQSHLSIPHAFVFLSFHHKTYTFCFSLSLFQVSAKVHCSYDSPTTHSVAVTLQQSV